MVLNILNKSDLDGLSNDIISAASEAASQKMNKVESDDCQSISLKICPSKTSDNSGAIRDMFQNHLLELLCLVAMEEPNKNSPESIRNENCYCRRRYLLLDECSSTR